MKLKDPFPWSSDASDPAERCRRIGLLNLKTAEFFVLCLRSCAQMRDLVQQDAIRHFYSSVFLFLQSLIHRVCDTHKALSIRPLRMSVWRMERQL